MIKINLLPREERKRHAPINTKLLLAGLAGVVALLAMGYGWFWLNGEVNRLQADIQQTQAELGASRSWPSRSTSSRPKRSV
jgi:hypothetical protein